MKCCTLVLKVTLRNLMILLLLVVVVYDGWSQYTKHDTHFVGVWGGSEKGEQIKNVQKNWIQYRYPNGTYKIEFTYTYDDGSHEVTVEKGKWWLMDGRYYEKSKRVADCYEVEIIDANHILFKAVKLTSTFVNSEYQFIDSRLLDKSL